MTVQKTTVDWLRFRTQTEPLKALEALKPMFGDLGQYLRLNFLQRGILGFQQGAEIRIADMPLGRRDRRG
jgi:hypothetical protein